MRDLVERAKVGDLEAFGVLVDRYKDMAYGASYAILGSFHDAQDATQDAFIHAWQKLGTLQDPASFPGWLYRITRNCSLDRVRRFRERTESIDDVADTLPDSGNRGPEQCAERRELHEAILEAIRSLSEPNRLATALFYINGYSVEEVADFLEVPAGTVKRRLHTSRTQLRERMVDMVEDTFKHNPLPKDFSRGVLQRIGDYACLDIIGAGPMGSVYLAEHPVLKQKVAIKIAADGSPGLQRFFRKERAVLDKLDHPGIVKIFSYGEHDGRSYVVMEFIDGSLLHGWLSSGKTHGIDEILRVMVRLADAVGHAHNRGMVVGCLQPFHIVMRLSGEPVIVDIVCSPGPLDEILAGPHWDLIRYLPPEHLKGEQSDEQTDIWNLGLLMYEMLAGKPLFDGEPGEEMVSAIQAPAPVDLSVLKDRAPDYVLAVLKKCLEKDPKDRFPSTAELLDALREAQSANSHQIPCRTPQNGDDGRSLA